MASFVLAASSRSSAATISRRALAVASWCLLIVSIIAEESACGFDTSCRSVVEESGCGFDASCRSVVEESACGFDASCSSVVEAVAQEDTAERSELGAESSSAPLAVELLQRGVRARRVSSDVGGEGVAALRREFPTNGTALWNQVRGAVQIEELQKQLQNVRDSEQAKQLDEQLSRLRAQYPAADEVKETLAGDWQKVITLEHVKAALEEAKKVSDMAVGQLQEQYNNLREHLPVWKSEEVKENAADTWSQVQSQGVPLPDLGSLEMEAQSVWNQGMDIAGKAGNSVGSAASSAGSSVANAASSAGKAMSDWWR